MAKKSAAKRVERLEGMVIGMGFLLMKLKASYGRDFGEGMRQQVDQALSDYRQVCAAAQQREVAQGATK
jgi:hypothetical protein